jgi:hypothetical protein
MKVEGLTEFLFETLAEISRIVKANLISYFDLLYCLSDNRLHAFFMRTLQIIHWVTIRSMLHSSIEHGLDIWISACRSGMDKSGLSIVLDSSKYLFKECLLGGLGAIL